MGKLFIGTSGYNYKDWKEDFYPSGLPQREWLHYFSTQFSTVEINATFYRSFPPHVYEKWYNTTAPGFLYTLKGPRTITHIKRLKNVDEDLEYFFGANAKLKEKLSCIIWQFPASFRNDPERFSLLKELLEKLPKQYRHAIELRHASWFVEDLYKLLQKSNIGFVISETESFDTEIVVTADFVFIRFHGPTALYASSYSSEELQQWSDKIKKWLVNKDVYVYFNNDISAHAVRNALELRDKIYLNVSHAESSPEL